jgi:hypothetical protein
MEAAWRALAEEQDWLNGEQPPAGKGLEINGEFVSPIIRAARKHDRDDDLKVGARVRLSRLGLVATV